jgi:hypothetical protein
MILSLLITNLVLYYIHPCPALTFMGNFYGLVIVISFWLDHDVVQFLMKNMEKIKMGCRGKLG